MKSALFAVVLTVLPSLPARADPSAGHWEAVARRDGRSWRFNIDIPAGRVRNGTVDLLDIAAYGVEFTATISGRRIHLERKTAAATTAIDGRIDGARIAGRLLFAGIDAPFSGTRRGAGPPALLTEEVVFRNGDVTLAGTLIRPAIDGPHPAVVCTHGSGPGDRQFAAYRSEGIYYSRLGIAALIYDRRGSGQSTGDAATASMEDLAGDALAGVELLKTARDIDARAIGVSGVSQGGWIAPLAASRSRDVAFVVVLSASGVNPMDQSIFDVRNALRRGGCSEAAVEQAIALRRRMYDSARSGVPDPGLAGAIESVHGEPWFSSSGLPHPFPAAPPSPGERQFLLFEPAPVWRSVSVPVLALWGGKDASVPASTSRDIVEGALRSGHNSDHTLILYPNADHGLRIVREKESAWDFPRVVPGARQFLAEWLREHLPPSRSGRPGVSEWTPS